MTNLYQASICEKIEMFEEMIGQEIKENDILIDKYDQPGCSQIQVLSYFKERLKKIQEEFRVAKKVIENM